MLEKLKLGLLGGGLAVFLLAAACTAAATATPAPTPTATPAPTATAMPEGAGMQLPPPTMTMLAEGVYHYFGFFASSLVVIGDDGVLITDPGNPLKAQSMIEEIGRLTDLPVTTVALSHEHYDHVGGTGLFPEAKIVCHRNCQPVFELDVLGDVPARVDEDFTEFKEIAVGDTVVELHHLAPGDGDGMAVIYLPREKILLTTDIYEPEELTHKNWVDDKNFTGVREILNTVSQWDAEDVLTAHSPLNSPEALAANTAYYNDLYDAVKAAVDDTTAQSGPFAVYGLFDTLPATLQLPQYQEWENYDSSFPRHVERMLLSIYHGD